MKSIRRLRESSWLRLVFLSAVAFLSAGCSSSTSSSGNNVNPLGAYQITNPTSGSLAVDGTIKKPGQIDAPIISIPVNGGGINGHDNAPLLDNMHPGWQQASCLTCHNDTSRNPDHNYTDSSMCYLCHGTNGLPGFGDTIPPIISGVVCTPTDKSVTINWKTDEACLSRIVIRTTGGDRLEFPVSTTYATGHRYTLNGLIPNTHYIYELIATDKSGNRTTSTTFGVLTFKTLEATSTTTTTTTSTVTPPVTTGLFTSIAISADGPFKAKVKFSLAEPARCTIFFVRKENNTLAEQSPLSGGQPITSFDNTLSGLQPNTAYIVFVEAKLESNQQIRKSSNYEIKTDSF